MTCGTRVGVCVYHRGGNFTITLRHCHVVDNDRYGGVAFMLTVGQAGSPLIEINGGNDIRPVAFAANRNLLTGGGGGVRVWGVEDGHEMATMAAMDVVSKDGRGDGLGRGDRVERTDIRKSLLAKGGILPP